MRIKTQSHACKGSSPGPNHWAYHQVEFLNSAIQADTLLPLAYRKIPRTHASLLSLPTIASAPTRSARSVRTNNGATDSTTTNTRRLTEHHQAPRADPIPRSHQTNQAKTDPRGRRANAARTCGEPLGARWSSRHGRLRAARASSRRSGRGRGRRNAIAGPAALGAVVPELVVLRPRAEAREAAHRGTTRRINQPINQSLPRGGARGTRIPAPTGRCGGRRGGADRGGERGGDGGGEEAGGGSVGWFPSLALGGCRCCCWLLLIAGGRLSGWGPWGVGRTETGKPWDGNGFQVRSDLTVILGGIPAG
jgi:hypothetical protein